MARKLTYAARALLEATLLAGTVVSFRSEPLLGKPSIEQIIEDVERHGVTNNVSNGKKIYFEYYGKNLANLCGADIIYGGVEQFYGYSIHDRKIYSRVITMQKRYDSGDSIVFLSLFHFASDKYYKKMESISMSPEVTAVILEGQKSDIDNARESLVNFADFLKSSAQIESMSLFNKEPVPPSYQKWIYPDISSEERNNKILPEAEKQEEAMQAYIRFYNSYGGHLSAPLDPYSKRELTPKFKAIICPRNEEVIKSIEENPEGRKAVAWGASHTPSLIFELFKKGYIVIEVQEIEAYSY